MSALLLGAAKAQPGSFPALRLRGARITGRLDLTGATINHAIVCEYCFFEDEVCFIDATTKSIRIVESSLPSFSGARLHAAGIIDFAGSVVEETLSLDRAEVIGEVCLRRAAVGRDPAAVAVSAEDLKVDGLVSCSEGFTCTGTLLLRGARITGALELSDAWLNATGSLALRADNAAIGGRFSGSGLKALGEVRLSNSRIGGWLSLIDARLSNPGDVALGGGGISVGGGFWCTRSFVAQGQVRLIGASIGGNIAFTDAHLSHPGGDALDLDHAVINGLDAGRLRVTDSGVTMSGVKITGSASLVAAELDGGAGKAALVANGATVSGSFDMRHLRARGELILTGCNVTGRIILSEAVLDNAPATALRLSRAQLSTDLFCWGMTLRGRLKLTGATVGSDVLLDEVSLSNPGQVVLDAKGLQAGTLILRPRERVEGRVSLQSARLGKLRDNPDLWPEELVLDGLVYGDLEPRLPAQDRLRWIEREPDGFQPLPYEQLAAWYTANGQPAEARRVRHSKERRQRDTKPLSGRIWGLLQDATIAYGYQPWRALFWLLGLLALGSTTFAISRPTPVNGVGAPHFNAVVYTLDLLLPVVDLGQKHAYSPAGFEQWLSYALIASGWILVTTIAAAGARTLKRN